MLLGNAVGLVLLSPVLGGPKATEGSRRLLMHLSTLAAILVTATWMLTQYAMQVKCSQFDRGRPFRTARNLTNMVPALLIIYVFKPRGARSENPSSDSASHAWVLSCRNEREQLILVWGIDTSTTQIMAQSR